MNRSSAIKDIERPPRADGFISIAALVGAIAGVLGIGFHIVNGVLVTAALKQPPPRLVELASGDTIATRAVGSLDREPQTIDKFTREVLGLMFTWTGLLPGEEGIVPDEGIVVGQAPNTKRLTTPAWQATLALSPELQGPMQVKIAELTPSAVFGGGDQVILNITHLAPPRPDPARTGYWTQTLVARLVRFQNGQVAGKPVAFNRKIYLRAVDPPQTSPLELSDIQRALREIRSSGLEIYKIEEVK